MTNKAVDQQTQVTTETAEKLGFYVVFQNVTYTSKGESKTQSAGSFSSDGFNSQTKDANNEGGSGTTGIITFSHKKSSELADFLFF